MEPFRPASPGGRRRFGSRRRVRHTGSSRPIRLVEDPQRSLALATINDDQACCRVLTTCRVWSSAVGFGNREREETKHQAQIGQKALKPFPILNGLYVLSRKQQGSVPITKCKLNLEHRVHAESISPGLLHADICGKCHSSSHAICISQRVWT